MNATKKQIKTLFTTAGFILCSSFTVLAAGSYDGQLDTVSGTVISGWAKDKISADTPVIVRLAIVPEGQTEAVKETTVIASEYRSTNRVPAHTSGYCGFSWDVDWSEFENGRYQIKMKSGTKDIKKMQVYTNKAGKEPAAREDANASAPAGGICPIGVFKTTAYCPCYRCSEGWGRKTSTGATARAKHTAAVDPRVIPYGSKLMIDGIIYTAEDRGGGVKGNHIDIFYDTHAETNRHGVIYKEVYLIP